VEFEKVGWGRWDARVRGGQGQGHVGTGGERGVLGSLREEEQGATLSVSPPASVPDSYAVSSCCNGNGGLQIPRLGAAARPGRRRDLYSAAGGSWGASSRGAPADFLDDDPEEERERSHSHSRDMDMDMGMPEHEADKMSLDGYDDDDDDDDDCASSVPEHAPSPVRLDDPADATDEEDWAAIGAAALRAGVVPGTGGLRSRCSKAWARRPSATLARSAPGRAGVGVAYRPRYQQRSVSRASGVGGMGVASVVHTSGSFGVGGGNGLRDEQEREAVEALMRMGSM